MGSWSTGLVGKDTVVLNIGFTQVPTHRLSWHYFYKENEIFLPGLMLLCS